MSNLKDYSMEIHFIMERLNELCKERYYERGTGEAKASTIAKNIRADFVKLMKKINSGDPSDFDGLFK